MYGIGEVANGRTYAIEVTQTKPRNDGGYQFYALNVYVDAHGKVVDYSGIPGDLPLSVAYFLKGQGFDVTNYV